jgi:thioredoxin-like negative regulator of GroEL
MAKEIEERDQFDEIVGKHQTDGKFLIFKFGAGWCRPCKRVDPYYSSYAKTHIDAEFYHMNIDEESIGELMSDDLKLKTIPHFAVFHNGNLLESFQTSQRDPLYKTLDRILNTKFEDGKNKDGGDKEAIEEKNEESQTRKHRTSSYDGGWTEDIE